MNFELNKDEVAILLDGLAQLPLARAYNLFQRLLPLAQAAAQPQPQPDPVDVTLREVSAPA
jgi:hypothetical protein